MERMDINWMALGNHVAVTAHELKHTGNLKNMILHEICYLDGGEMFWLVEICPVSDIHPSLRIFMCI